MKKALIAGAMVLCIALGSGVAAYAAGGTEFPSSGGLNSRFDFENIQAEMQTNIQEMREKASDMSAYEQYGLTSDEAKGGWCYDGKLVGLFVDKQGRGISYLSGSGEVHVRAVRNESGELTGLALLSEDEYNAIVAELDGLKYEMQTHMNEMRQNMQERMNRNFESIQSGLFDPPAFKEDMGKMHEDMQEQMAQMKAKIEQRFNK